MKPTLKQLRAEMRESSGKGTQGEWVWGDTTVFDEDREAQRMGKPFWTLVEGGSMELYQGPLGRKIKDHNECQILRAIGYEADGVHARDEDMRHILAARPENTARILNALDRAEEALMGIGYHGCATGDCPHATEQECQIFFRQLAEDARAALEDMEKL